MGLITKGILGSISGTVGPVVLCTVNSQEVIKSKPKKSTKAPVQSQLDQRSKFAMITEFISYMKNIIVLGYQIHKNKKASPTNIAVKYHLENAITGVSPDFKIDFTKVVISVGKLATSFAAGVPAEGRKFNLTWDDYHDNEDKVLRNTDYLVVLFYDEITKLFLTYRKMAVRGDLALEIPISHRFIVNPIHCWTFFVSADGLTTSKSEYLGEFKMLE